jgi:DNA-binding CsgD family transcriptional regulator
MIKAPMNGVTIDGMRDAKSFPENTVTAFEAFKIHGVTKRNKGITYHSVPNIAKKVVARLDKSMSGLEAENQPFSLDGEPHVRIFGPLKLQNELMREFLVKSTGLTCACWQDSEQGLFDIKPGLKPLILWDCVELDPVSIWARLDAVIYSQTLLALFNVSPDLGIYREAISRGVRGIFFENESPGVLSKGVQAILNGELWFSRDILAKCLLETGDSARDTEDTQPHLTSREKEILIMVASGSTNSKIAEELCVSPHTVKTHIYNIFKKINVPNRLQAALWATKYLFDL